MELDIEKIRLNLPEQINSEFDRLMACDHNYEHNWEYRPLVLLEKLFSGFYQNGYSARECSEFLLKVGYLTITDQERLKRVFGSESVFAELKQLTISEKVEKDKEALIVNNGILIFCLHSGLISQVEFQDPKLLVALYLVSMKIFGLADSIMSLDIYKLTKSYTNAIRETILFDEIFVPINKLLGKSSLKEIVWDQLDECLSDFDLISNYRIDHKRFFYLLKNRFNRNDREFILRQIHGVVYADLISSVESNDFKTFSGVIYKADNVDTISAVCNMFFKTKQLWSVSERWSSAHPEGFYLWKVVANANNIKDKYKAYHAVQKDDLSVFFEQNIDDSESRKWVRIFFSVLFAVFKPAVVAKIEDIINKSQLKDYISEVLAEEDDSQSYEIVNDAKEREADNKSNVEQQGNTCNTEISTLTIQLREKPILPDEYIEEFCKRFAANCDNERLGRIKFFFWGQNEDRSLPVVTDDNPIHWNSTTILFTAYLHLAYGEGKNLPIGISDDVYKGVRDKKNNNMKLPKTPESDYKKHMNRIKSSIGWKDTGDESK